jgi:predicted transposase
MERLRYALCMDLPLTLKLRRTQEQASVLQDTMGRVNAACNTIAEIALGTHPTNKVRLHQLVYLDIRATLRLVRANDSAGHQQGRGRL